MKVKSFCLFLFLFITMTSTPALAANPFDFDAAYSWALEAGFSEAFLADIDEKTLQHVYENSSSGESLLIEEASAADSDNGIGSDKMHYTITTVKLLRGDTIDQINIYVTATWQDGRPYLRFVDYMDVSWNETNWVYAGEMDDGSVENSFLGTISSKAKDGNRPDIKHIDQQPAIAYIDLTGWFVHLGDYTGLGDIPTARMSFSLIPKDTTLSAEELLEGFFVKSTYTHSLLFWLEDSVSVKL